MALQNTDNLLIGRGGESFKIEYSELKVPNSLTAGSYLSGGSFDGSGAVTFNVQASSANVADRVVVRDSNGDFAMGSLTVEETSQFQQSAQFQDVATFAGITTHSDGIKVTGGTQADFTIIKNTANNSLLLTADQDEALTLQIGYKATAGSYSLACGTGKGDYRDKYGCQVTVFDSSYTGPDNLTRGFFVNALNTYGQTTELFSTNFIAANATVSDTTYGFVSRLNKNNDASKQLYNFYAEGSAPNYFRGGVRVGDSIDYGEISLAANSSVSQSLKLVRSLAPSSGIKAIEVIANGTTQWSVGYDGIAAFSAFNGNVQIQMEADNPAAFTTDYVLEEDEEGNEVQVENTTYTGTTETLLDIIRELRARVAAIETNEVSDDAVDSALLTLVANLSSRLTALEENN